MPFLEVPLNNRKIDVLLLEARKFIAELHIVGTHWGGIHTFNSEVLAWHNGNPNVLDTDKDFLISRLFQLPEPSGGTALYDSIIGSLNRLFAVHMNAGRRGIPMMLITFTDGEDASSKSKVSDVRETIKKFNFFPDNNCFMAIVGVGKDVNKSTLIDICKSDSEHPFGYGQFEHTDSINGLYNLFLQIVIKIGIQKGIIPSNFTFQVGNMIMQTSVLQEVAQQVTNVMPIDYILNLDISGSMG
ncbi:VWA domain-containing protein [Candidatus Nomurabacteria bacterium]|nr:VWA domain-containing protein [Candidatus Nomurabacteria bacterium]